MNKIKKKTIIIYLLVIACLYAVIYVIPTVTGAMVGTYTVEYGSLRVYDETDGYFVRDEKVYLATSGGKENRYIDGNTLVKKGTTILEITGNSDGEIDSKFTDILRNLEGDSIKNPSYISQDEGVVSYYVDGYENKFTPEKMENLSYDTVSKVESGNVISLTRDSVVRGEPVFKIVGNSKWYLLCYVDSTKADNYIVGNRITIGFEDEDIKGWVKSVNKQGTRLQVIVETNNYYEKYDRYRVAKVFLITSDKNGLIIENDSIAEENGQQGVYVQNKYKRYIFVPISVIATDGEKSVIEKSYFYNSEGVTVETVNTYDEILKSPKDAKIKNQNNVEEDDQ